MTGFDLPSNFHDNPESLVRRVRPRLLILSYGHPWAHYSGGYQDRLLGGPLGLLILGCTTPTGVERKDYRGILLGSEATHVRIHVKYS
jgi:hypothetical protein